MPIWLQFVPSVLCSMRKPLSSSLLSLQFRFTRLLDMALAASSVGAAGTVVLGSPNRKESRLATAPLAPATSQTNRSTYRPAASEMSPTETVCQTSHAPVSGTLTEPLPGAGGIFYRSSKAALNKAMQQVARALRDRGVTVLLMHPGAVATERQAYLADFPGMIDTPFSVTSMIATLDAVAFDSSTTTARLRRGSV